MDENNDVRVEIRIRAPAAKVWEALTKPEIVKQYLFGTDMKTDWNEGSPITYSGVWEGKAYEDKGRIIRIVPDKLISTTYWSSMSGLPDSPENYKTVRYALAAEGDHTKLTLTQGNNRDSAEAEHSRKNWAMVLGKLKELLEKP